MRAAGSVATMQANTEGQQCECPGATVQTEMIVEKELKQIITRM
jgi:hypothetical protein